MGIKPIKEQDKKQNKGVHFSSLMIKDSHKAEITLNTLEQIGSDQPIEKEDLSGIMEEIHLLGKKMNDTQGMSDLLAYKEAVRKFLTFITTNNYQIKKRQYSINHGLAHKELTLITTIDEKLEALGMEFLAVHKKNLDLLKEVDEIQGLLLNLVA